MNWQSDWRKNMQPKREPFRRPHKAKKLEAAIVPPSPFKSGDKVRITTMDPNTREILSVETLEVCGVSRFEGLVIVDDVAFRNTDDGRWIGQHSRGRKRIVKFMEPAK